MIGQTVFDATIERLRPYYADGHTLVVSFSGGKDSGVAMEMAILAAEAEGRLPVKVIHQDEEIMYPGTYEYVERVAKRKETDFTWLVRQNPNINIANREQPYYWSFDPRLKPEEWMRIPPKDAAWETDLIEICSMTNHRRFKVEDDKMLIAVVGMRAAESRGRNMGIYSAKSYLVRENAFGVRNLWAVYDWKDGDIWKAINDNGWDHNHAYDVLHRMGLSRSRLRIAPPCMAVSGIPALQRASKAWPQWFDRLCVRLPGVRLLAHYGKRAVEARRRRGETWEATFKRECITEAPGWIARRSAHAMDIALRRHEYHSSTIFPEAKACTRCKPAIGSWKALTKSMYLGDPFSSKTHNTFSKQGNKDGALDWCIEPAFFWPEAPVTKWEVAPIW